MLIKSFVASIIIDISYNLYKCMHYKHVYGNEKLLEIFACPSKSRAFYGPEVNL